MLKLRKIIKRKINRNKWLRQEINTRKYEFRSYYRALKQYSNKPQTKFIIFAQWRTGSTLLEQMLNCHPDINCDKEIFNIFSAYTRPKKIVLFPNLLIKGNSANFDSKAYGFNLKLYQIKHFSPEYLRSPKKFIKKLHNQGWKIIYLKRNNILRQAISFRIANNKGRWHDCPDNPTDRSKVYIDFGKLLTHLQLCENLTFEEKEILKDIPHLKLLYENNLLKSEDHQKTCNLVFDYLDLENCLVKAKLNKISTGKLEDMIENYDEIFREINKTKYSRYLSG